MLLFMRLVAAHDVLTCHGIKGGSGMFAVLLAEIKRSCPLLDVGIAHRRGVVSFPTREWSGLSPSKVSMLFRKKAKLLPATALSRFI